MNSQSRPNEALTLLSPAKVNLFFRVLRKRADGYHEIASLVQTVSLCDTVSVRWAEEDVLECDDPKVPTDQTNLMWKSVELFRNETGWKERVHLVLGKKIPMQAGLGGGSSNAATVLWGLNRLTGMGIEDAVLAEWAGRFSSDAPLFFSSGTAYCEGRGEKVRDVPCCEVGTLSIAKPDAGLSTPAVYQQLTVEQCEERDPEECLREARCGRLTPFNDLECSAFSLLPSLRAYKTTLEQSGFRQVVLTGSGTAFVCFGQGAPHPQLSWFSVVPLHRKLGNWYEFPEIC